jgi:polyisoprenoid-binding protein YceI
MPITPGTYEVGPQNAELLVSTRRSGAAAKAGHDLLIEVTGWSGAFTLGEHPSGTSITLRADGGSLRVRDGRGGIQALQDEDRENIRQTIDDEVLKRAPIEFRSSSVESGPDVSRLRVRGELELAGQTRPIEFELVLADDGLLTGNAAVKQSDWGIKPYSGLFGTLKVVDEVQVSVDAKLER